VTFVAPFFIMHLPKLPTIFVKNGEERKAFFTVQARELLAAGWVEKGEEEVKKDILKKKVKPTVHEKKSPVAAKFKAKKGETKQIPPKVKELIEGPSAEEPASEAEDE